MASSQPFAEEGITDHGADKENTDAEIDDVEHGKAPLDAETNIVERGVKMPYDP